MLPKVYRQSLEVSSSLSLPKIEDEEDQIPKSIIRSHTVTSLAKLKVGGESLLDMKLKNGKFSHTREDADEVDVSTLNKSSAKELIVP